MLKVIHCELMKNPKFHPIEKYYMHKTELVRENETHKISWDFEMQMDHLIPARRPDLVLYLEKENKLASNEFCCTRIP